MDVNLLYRTGFAPTNGSSVQISRILKGHEPRVRHVMWDPGEAGSESICKSYIAIEQDWTHHSTRGNSFLKSIYTNLMKVSLQTLGAGKRSAKSPSLPQWSRTTDRVVAVCMQESDAKIIYGLWRNLGKPPLLLHVMDILHETLSEQETPFFISLIREAKHIFGISKPIITELSRFSDVAISELLFTSDFQRADTYPSIMDLRIVMVGTIWDYEQNRILELLADAWPTILEQHPQATLHYAGLSFNRIPQLLQRFVQNHGHLSTSQCENLLQSCHIAVLPVSHPMNHVSRYSLPSRIADYLACGLPTIVSAEPGTATHSFFENVPQMAGMNIQTTSDLIEAINNYFSNAKGWKEHSLAASKFAETRLSVPVIQNQFWQVVSSLG
jgi:glycosyltransferase involved in cell wall biosynthesis